MEKQDELKFYSNDYYRKITFDLKKYKMKRYNIVNILTNYGFTFNKHMTKINDNVNKLVNLIQYEEINDEYDD